MPTGPLEMRSFSASYFVLIIDGDEVAGFLKSVEGGGIKGELIAQQIGAAARRTKHINNPSIEPVTVQVGMSMSPGFYEWVRKSWQGEVERRNGSIISFDANFKPVHEWSFTQALILETTIPALDAGSKEPAFMTVKFQAETAEHKFNPGGSKVPGIQPKTQKTWLASNFRLDIDGIDVSRVNKIESFTVKQNVKPVPSGPDWMYQLMPTSLEFPNLTVSMSLVGAQPMFDWHKQFVVDGINRHGNEKTGAITFLDTSLKRELLTIDLKALGVCNILVDKAEAGSAATSIRKAKVELYCEEMDFTYAE